MDSVLTCMVSDSIGHGERARRLASEVAEYVGVAGGIAVREQGHAIRLALDLLEIPAGSKIIMSALSPKIYERIVLEKGCDPLRIDVVAENGCISPVEAERALADHPAAMIVATPLGFVPELAALSALGIPIIEDISTGIGGNIGDRACGTFGRYVIVSLEEENIITSGGGALVLASGKKELASLRAAAAGLPPTSLLSDMNAALGITQVAAVEQFILKRKEIARVYTQALLKSRHKTLIPTGEGENTWFSFPVLLSGSMKEAIQYARKKGVETVPAFHDTIAAGLDSHKHAFPNARALFLRCLLFPLYPTMGKQNIALVTKVLSTLP